MEVARGRVGVVSLSSSEEPMEEVSRPSRGRRKSGGGGSPKGRARGEARRARAALSPISKTLLRR